MQIYTIIMELTVIFSKICDFFGFYFHCQDKRPDSQPLQSCVDPVGAGPLPAFRPLFFRGILFSWKVCATFAG